jgi:hypothetical protein
MGSVTGMLQLVKSHRRFSGGCREQLTRGTVGLKSSRTDELGIDPGRKRLTRWISRGDEEGTLGHT